MRNPWDDDLEILSAENVNFAVETAGLGSRFAAATIDLTLQGLVMALVGIAGNLLLSYLPPLNTWGQFLIGTAQAFGALLLFAILWGYYFLFEWLWDGQTPGKRWLHLRVLMTSGMAITPWAALVRNLLRIADFLPLCYGIGAFIAVVNPNNRRAGDLVAGTIVARERHDVNREVLSISQAADAFLAQFTAAPASVTATVATPPAVPVASVASPSVQVLAAPLSPSTAPEEFGLLRRLTEQDYDLARDFLVRRDKLDATTRTRLSHSIATQLANKLGQPLPAAPQTEAFLEWVVRSWQQPSSTAR
jgi:uncharacterized RDD family membrane protein YckC